MKKPATEIILNDCQKNTSKGFLKLTSLDSIGIILGREIENSRVPEVNEGVLYVYIDCFNYSMYPFYSLLYV